MRKFVVVLLVPAAFLIGCSQSEEEKLHELKVACLQGGGEWVENGIYGTDPFCRRPSSSESP